MGKQDVKELFVFWCKDTTFFRGHLTIAVDCCRLFLISCDFSVSSMSRSLALISIRTKRTKRKTRRPVDLLATHSPCHIATLSLILGTKHPSRWLFAPKMRTHFCAPGRGECIESRSSGVFLWPFRKEKCQKISLFEGQFLLDRQTANTLSNCIFAI